MASYRLKSNDQQEHVFVTQFTEDQQNDELLVLAGFPGGRPIGQLIEENLTTTQQTDVLRTAVEDEVTKRELETKRAEFEARMKICAEKKADVQLRQQRMRDRVAKFEKFVNENEVKRQRAIQKYQLEVRLREQKRIELTANDAQLGGLTKRRDMLKNKLMKSKKYEDYLLSALDILPEHYLEVTDTRLNSLMMRHRTLSDTNTTLMEHLNSIADDLDKLKQHLEGLVLEHERLKLAINSKLSQKQDIQERKLNENRATEERLVRQKMMSRQQAVDYGHILMAIDNLAEKSRLYVEPPVESMKLDNRIQTIEDYITHKFSIITMAVQAGRASPSSSRR